jgi:ferredoxin-NADP reductase
MVVSDPNVDKKFILTEKIDETPEVLIVRFKSADGHMLQFEPGMFVMIYGIDKQTKKIMAARAFSIASIPDSDEVELFIIKSHPFGNPPIMHESFFVNAPIGTEFYLRKDASGMFANGQFRFDPKINRKVTFIAGGTGLAPFMSMLRMIKEKSMNCDVVLMYSIKYPTEIIRKQELEQLVSELHGNMVVSVTRPQPGDGWKGQTGHIDANMLINCVPDIKSRANYVCGPLAFVKAIKDALISLGVPQNEIKADVWG